MNYSLVTRASKFAWEAHASIGQKRKYTGEPYWVHPSRVADILIDHRCSQEAVAAAFLHDVLEDVAPKNPNYGEATILAEFGPRILAIVKEVTDVSKPEDGNREVRKAIDRLHYAAASADGQNVKLADLIDNTKDIAKNDKDFAVTYLREKEAILKELTRGKASLRAEAWLALTNARNDLGV